MKKILILGTVAALSLLNMGCNKKQKETSSESGIINLQLHYYKQENQEGLASVIKAFERSNPDIHIELHVSPNGDDTEMSGRADIGTLPDILQMQSYARVKEYASRGLLVDLTKDPIMGKVLPSALSAVSWNGKQYALPMDYAGIGIIYNKEIFHKYNLTPPETMSEMKAVCAVLKSKGIEPFAALLKDNWSMGHFITMIHTALLREKNIDPDKFITDMNASKSSYGLVNTTKLFNVLDFYNENLSADAPNMDGSAQQRDFANGKAAMMVQGLWAYVDALKINPKLNAGFVPFPVYEDEKMNVFYADVDSAFGVSSQSSKEKHAAAMRFMNWLTTLEGENAWMKDYKLIPPFKGVDVSSFGGTYVDLMHSVEAKGSSPWAFSQYPTEVFDDSCKNGAQAYMLHNKSANALIRDIDKQWNAAVTK